MTPTHTYLDVTSSAATEPDTGDASREHIVDEVRGA